MGSHELPNELARARSRRLKLELPWLSGDRMKLLERTTALLQKGKGEEALVLVRMASINQPCTIVWNAIIDDLCKNHKVKEAFRVYNDVRGAWVARHVHDTNAISLTR